jgi:hypothetical protein
MPYFIRYSPIKSRPGEPWAILNEDQEIVGRSSSEEKAKASVRARLAGEHGAFKSYHIKYQLGMFEEGPWVVFNENKEPLAGFSSQEKAELYASTGEGMLTKNDNTETVVVIENEATVTQQQKEEVRMNEGEQPRHRVTGQSNVDSNQPNVGNVSSDKPTGGKFRPIPKGRLPQIDNY